MDLCRPEGRDDWTTNHHWMVLAHPPAGVTEEIKRGPFDDVLAEAERARKSKVTEVGRRRADAHNEACVIFGDKAGETYILAPYARLLRGLDVRRLHVRPSGRWSGCKGTLMPLAGYRDGVLVAVVMPYRIGGAS